MAGRAALVYDDQERVGIAVDEDIPYRLEMARRFALMPQLLPAAAVKPRFAAFDGLLQRLGIHIGYHEDLAAPPFLHDGRHEASIVKFYIRQTYCFHYSAPLMATPCSFRYFFSSGIGICPK